MEVVAMLDRLIRPFRRQRLEHWWILPIIATSYSVFWLLWGIFGDWDWWLWVHPFIIVFWSLMMVGAWYAQPLPENHVCRLPGALNRSLFPSLFGLPEGEGKETRRPINVWERRRTKFKARICRRCGARWQRKMNPYTSSPWWYKEGDPDADRRAAGDPRRTGTNDPTDADAGTGPGQGTATAIGPGTFYTSPAGQAIARIRPGGVSIGFNMTPAAAARIARVLSGGLSVKEMLIDPQDYAEAVEKHRRLEEGIGWRQVPGAVIGWRVWEVSPNSGGFSAVLLRGWGKPAECHRDGYNTDHVIHADDVVPAWNCSCGYHALDEPDFSRFLTQDDYTGGGTIIGLCMGWGKVIRHEHGWRAQYAKPLCFLAKPELGVGQERYNKFVRVVGQELDVPMMTYKQAQAYVSEWMSKGEGEDG